ncbi:uncharacterized protein ColSpa_12559 [Colletotrichum spaethianum]|uniref:Uncharacterized protein n=1 Tax=Colletotrichum spaethianum TaxID=700344 RepID=A0AA37PHP3_9PEZI|nr:uncharacterized protein ColSpa_12559 [Colletotrichum spaethianum]GKT52378.1 hypothetical protein ColSpa_12559 [Colletotrichum spaethianum]
MSTPGPELNRCPVEGCDWEPRTAGNCVQRHISIRHGKQMPCGAYVLKGNDRNGQDRVRGHQDGCRECQQDVKDPVENETDNSTTSSPEPSLGIGSDIREIHGSININKMTVHGTIIHNLVVSQTNIPTAST